MGKIIYFQNWLNTKGEDMCKEFVTKIRSEKNNICDMADRARDVLHYFNVGETCTDIPIVEILNKLGFKIYQTELEPTGLSAYIAVDPQYEEAFGSNKITCVHADESLGHKRFALAHELAHYLFDFNDNKQLCYYNTYFPNDIDEKVEEKRANKFAANLLMPEEVFKRKYDEYKELQSKADIVCALSKEFKVSPTAILKRFEELGIKGYEYNMGN